MEDNTSSCANCGKGEENSITLKKCGACKMVKYCSSACQKAHRPQHKKECKQRAAELHEEALFKQPPPRDDCPICMLPLSYDPCNSAFESCCGKVICTGCVFSMAERCHKSGLICPFCRVLSVNTDEEENQRMQKLVDAGNARAIVEMGSYYTLGMYNFPLDHKKALELFQKAAELDYAEGYYNLGVAHAEGNGVKVDKKKAIHFYELPAMNGSVTARYNLGILEGRAGNVQRAYRHFIIAANAGHVDALGATKRGFKDEFITKDEYATTLRAYQKLHDEMKSDERDRAKERGFTGMTTSR